MAAFHRLRTLAAAFALLAVAPAGCKSADDPVTAVDWSQGSYEVLRLKSKDSAEYVRAALHPELATTPNLKAMAGIARMFGSAAQQAEAADLLSAACEEGQMRACREFGGILFGRGALEDAAGFYARACDGGNLFGCADLANNHSRGAGVEQDAAKAAAYADLACADLTSAACTTAIMDFHQVDEPAAMVRYAKACEAGNLWGCHWSGTRRIRSADSSGHGAGLSYLETGCKAGLINSCGAILEARLDHKGLSEAYALAEAILEKACAKGHTEACQMLAYSFSHGEAAGIPKDPVRAFRFTKSACETGNNESCLHLAEYYRDGIGTRRDVKAALKVYRRLCAEKEPLTCREVSKLEAELAPPRAQLAAASPQAQVDRTCELGDGLACRSIAWAHVFGEDGRTKDLQLAARHFSVGCDKGEPSACIDIGSLNDWAQFGFAENKSAARAWYKRACDLKSQDGCVLLAQSSN